MRRKEFLGPSLALLCAFACNEATWVGERGDKGLPPPLIPKNFKLEFFDNVGDITVVQVTTWAQPVMRTHFFLIACAALQTNVHMLKTSSFPNQIGLQWATLKNLLQAGAENDDRILQ